MSSESSGKIALPKAVDEASISCLCERLKSLSMPLDQVEALIQNIISDYRVDESRDSKEKRYKNELPALVTEIGNGETVFSYTPVSGLIREVHIARFLIVDSSKDQILIEAGQIKKGKPIIKQDPLPAEKVKGGKTLPDTVCDGFYEEFRIPKETIQLFFLTRLKDVGIMREDIKTSPSYPIPQNRFINYVYYLDVAYLDETIKKYFFGPNEEMDFTRKDLSGGKTLIFQWKNISSTAQWQINIEGSSLTSVKSLDEVLLPYREHLQKGEGEQSPPLEPELNL